MSHERHLNSLLSLTTLHCWAAVSLVWLLSWASVSAQATFEAQVESPEVVQGSRFEVSFILKNAEGQRFKAPDFGGLRPAGGISEIFGSRIDNGRVSTQHIWRIALEAPQTGTFSIGPATVTAGGKLLTSKPLTIRVTKPRSSSGSNVTIPQGSDGQIFIASEFDRSTAYPGQQITWRVQLYYLLPVEQSDLLELPDFAGFFHREKRRYDTSERRLTLNGKKYRVRTLYEEAIFPQETGSLIVGPATARAFVERGGPMGAMLGPVPVVLRSQPVALNVKPLPQPAPPNFSGCVGRYNWEVSSDKTELSTDDALTLTLTLQGNGDARQFAPPKLTLPAGLEAFDPKTRDETEQETAAELTHRAVLDYALLPKAPGRYALWPEFVFFDPDSNRYRSLHPADSLRIVVAPGTHYQPPSALNDTAQQTLPPPVQQPDTWDQTLRSPLLWAALLLPLTALVAFFFSRKKQRQPAAAPHAAVRQPVATAPTAPPPAVASTTAKSQLAAARRLLTQTDQPREFYDALYHTLQAWLSEHLEIPPARLNLQAAQQELIRRRIPENRITALLTAWQACEQAVFAGSVLSSERMAETLRLAEEGMGL